MPCLVQEAQQQQQPGLQQPALKAKAEAGASGGLDAEAAGLAGGRAAGKAVGPMQAALLAAAHQQQHQQQPALTNHQLPADSQAFAAQLATAAVSQARHPPGSATGCH